MKTYHKESFIEEDSVSSLRVGFIITVTAAMKPLLRPSARRELVRFASRIDRNSDAIEFLKWANRVLVAHREDSRSIRKGKTAAIVAQTSLPIFRRPERAFRPRLIFI